jgi:hypothetical protein
VGTPNTGAVYKPMNAAETAKAAKILQIAKLKMLLQSNQNPSLIKFAPNRLI